MRLELWRDFTCLDRAIERSGTRTPQDLSTKSEGERKTDTMRSHLSPTLARGLMVVVGLLVLLAHAGTAQAAPDAILVIGEVEIADADASPSDLIVNVHAGFGEGFAVVGQTQPDPSGRYDVELPLRPDNRMFVSVNYQGVTYSTQPIDVPAEGPVRLMPITVFPTTDDQSVIRVESSTIIVAQIDPQQQQMTVLEMMTLVNESTSVYIGDKRGEPGTGVPGVLNRTLTVDLPEGAGSFQMQRGLGAEDLMPSAGRFYFTEPVFPGRRQIVYSYEIGYPFSVHLFARPLSYRTDLIRVLMPEIGARIDSPDLDYGGLTELQGRSYQMLFGADLPAGTTVRVQVSGLPVRPIGAQLDFTTMRILAGILVLLALGAIGFYGFRSRADSSPGPASNRADLAASQEKTAGESRRPGVEAKPIDE